MFQEEIDNEVLSTVFGRTVMFDIPLAGKRALMAEIRKAIPQYCWLNHEPLLIHNARLLSDAIGGPANLPGYVRLVSEGL